ncbi:MAG: DUF2142 domain-containing protein [Eubacterium sp.]|nr:DUF2142 domain-containing protein [Eubacterium sp.]
MRQLLDRMIQRIPAFLILVVFWFVISMLRPLSDAEQAVSMSARRTDETAVLENGETLQLSFDCNQSNLKGVIVYFGSSSTTKRATAGLYLLDDTGSQIAAKDITKDDISNTGAYQMDFPELPDSDGKHYTIAISNQSKKKNSTVGVLLANPTVRNDRLSKDGTELSGSINYMICYRNVTAGRILRGTLLAIMLASFLLVILMGENLSRNFLMLAVFAGLIIILNPMPHHVDEPTHISKTFDISEGHLVYKMIDGESGVYVPENYHEFSAGYRNNIDLKTIVSDYEALSVPFSDRTVFEEMEYMNSYPFFAYLPMALAFWIFRLFHAPGYLVFLMGRLFNYAVYVTLGYFAVRRTKHYQGLVFGVLLLPLVLTLAGSIHSDALLDACAVLMVSIALHYRFDEDAGAFGKKDMVLFFICVLGIASSKYLIYTPVLLFFFLIPKEKFASGRQRWILLCSGVALALALGGFQLVLMKIYPYTETRVENVDVGAQIAYIMQNKKQVIDLVCLHFVKNLREYLLLSEPVILDKALPSVEFFIPAALWVAAILEPEKKLPEGKKKQLALGGLILFFAVFVGLLIVASEYVGYSAVGAASVNGVQPRYFYPLLLPCLLVFAMCFKKIRGGEHYRRNLSFVMLVGITELLMSAFISM